MIPLLVFLLACVSVYVGTLQASFTALMRLSVRFTAERNGLGDLLQRYLEEPALLFIPARLLLGLVVILVSLLFVAAMGAETFRHLGALALSLGAFVLVCEHLLPRLIIRRNPHAVLDALLPSFRVLTLPLFPVTRALLRLSTPRERAAAPEERDQPEAARPHDETSEAPAPEGVIRGEEQRLLESIVDFGARLVREVMTPRPDIVAIPTTATIDDLRRLLREQEYSRVPVYRENLDNIAGFVFVKDLIQLEGSEEGQRPISTIMRPAYFVPETKRVPELLQEFQRKQVQSAIVVDEYGGTAGLVTLEDLLEELVGEIRDEYDVESEPVVDEGNGTFVFSGKVPVDEVADRLGVEIEREGFETVGGFLLTHLGRVPVVGETFDIDDLGVEVLEAERRRVHRVRIRRRQPVAERS